MVRMARIYGALYVWGSLRSPSEFQTLSSELAHLRALNLETAAEAEIKASMNAFGRGYVTRSMWSSHGTAFRCGRPTDPENLWGHYGDLWAPPAEITPLGRFNKEKRPVLYVSGDPLTALVEVQPQPMQYRTLLILKRREGKIHFVQLGVERLPRAPAYEHGFGEVLDGLAAEPQFVEFLESHGIRQFWNIQNDYFTDVCTRVYPADQASAWYRLTHLIGAQLQKSKGVIGITYPSVANFYNGMNIAISTNDARAILKPTEAWLVAVAESTDPFTLSTTARVIRRASIDAAGNLHWGNHGSWSLHDLHLEIAPIQPTPQ